MKGKPLPLFAIVYTVLLVLFSVYVLLEAFVLPQGMVVVEETASLPAASAATDNGVSYSAHSSTADSGQTPAVSEATADSASASSVSQSEITDTSYADDNIRISIQSLTYEDTQVYIADVQLTDAAYLKTAFAQNTYGKNIKAATSEMAEENGAILAINGDYYGFRNAGFVLRNGVIYRDTTNGDAEALAIYEDGGMAVVRESSTSLADLQAAGAVQVLSFGPGLVEDGEITVGSSEEVGQAMTSNPRTAIGMVSPLHYLFVVSDGRTQESAGLSLYQLAQLMQQQGCTVAYNLDGGGSSTMVFCGQILNNPTGGHGTSEREVSDIVYIG